MFSDFFVFMGDSDDSGERPRYRYSRKQNCPPTTEVINVTLEDLYNGKEKTFKVTKNAECEECKGTGSIKYPSQKCVTCHGKGKYAAKIENGKNNKKKKGGNTYQKHCARCDGRGRIEAFTSKCQNCNGKSIVRAAKCYKVNITRGMRDQQSITFTGQGDQKDGMEAGDLVFVIKCKKHDIFERKGDDLVIEKKIELSEALCGTSVVIQHIDGKTFVVQREQFSGDLSDLSCRVKNKGMPIPCTNGKYGSLIIKFEVVFPPSYFFQDESLYKELEEALPPKPKAEPISEDSEEVTLYEYDKDRYKHADKDRNAYDSDEVEEEEDFGGPQCRVH